ncbi:MAG: alpha/beta fold hydrolase [Janthinobacterium lividum]
MSASIKNIASSKGFPGNPVLVAGPSSGAPTVYLHGLLGQDWDGLLDTLSQKRRVYSPAHPGSDQPDELKDIDDIHDLVLYYDELFDKLELDQVDLVGHSLGGMLAAEIAACYPKRVRKLVLIDPLGLWMDETPVQDFLLVNPNRLAELMLGDPHSEAVKSKLAMPEDPAAKVTEILRRFTTMASVAHFLWPIPERGLKKRLHRITADTLIIWGEQDKFVPRAYAEQFSSQIRGARVEVIAGAGHTPQFSHGADVAAKIESFLGR